jgi:acetyl esterase/lipase
MFPTQLWDVTGLVEEIVAGTGLPIDRGRVAMGGVGAGASVALGAVQTPELQGVVKAVAAIAPVVDWSVPFDAKATSELADPEAALLYDMMDWSYVPPRFDRADPMLSPEYAAQGKLPPHVFLAGIEGDILCPEAERLATRLVSERGPGGPAEGDSWESAGVKWERVKGWPQSFFELAVKAAKADKGGDKASLEPLVDELGDWLWRTVYA